MLEKANYTRLTRQQLEEALADSSLFKIRLDVEFDDFEDVVFFARGGRVVDEEAKKLLKKETVQVERRRC